MNKINPLYIIALLLFLLLLLVYKNSSMQTKLQTVEINNKNSLKEAKEIASLKRAFKSENRNKTALNSILNHPQLKKYNSQKEVSNSRMSITLENIDKKAFDTLSSKIFNSTLKIDSFMFERVSENNITVKAEVLL